MRIAVHAEGRELRGNERQVLLIVQGLVERGHEVFASCRRESDTGRALREAGAQVTGIRPRGDLDLVSTLAFARWLRRMRPDGVLLTSWKRLVSAAGAARIAGAGPVVMRMGGVHGLQRGLRRAATRHVLLRHVDYVYANSEEVRQHLLRAVPGLAPERVVRIGNAVEVRDVPPLSLHDLLRLPRGARVLFSAGGLERRKGHDIALQALARLPASVHLAIAGEGPQRDALAQLSAELQLDGRAHLLGQREDVPALLRGSDAYVLASRAEGMAVGLMEAMAAGCVCIATAVGGVQELLGERPGTGAAGWIVPRNDPAALADAILAAAGRAAEQRSAEARRRIATEYTKDRLVQRVEALFDRGRPGGTKS